MESLFEIRFVATHRMLAENVRKYGVGPRIPTVVICTAVFAAMIYYLCRIGMWEQMRIPVSILLAIEIAVFFIPHMIAWARCKVCKKQNGGKMPETIITVSDAIEYQEHLWNMRFEYADLTGTLRLKHSYKLRFTGRRSLLVNPNGFTKGTFEDFKQFLREKRPDLVISN